MENQNSTMISDPRKQQSDANQEHSLTDNPQTYSISLCICTMNRADDLDRCLASVMQSQEPPDEVIVSDDSPDPNPTKAVVARYREVTYQPGPKRGLGPNRNACIRSAKSSHLIFIDDDVCVPREFFTEARKAISSQPESLITGYEMNHGGGGRWSGEVRKVVPYNADFWGLQRIPVSEDYRAITINSTIFPQSLFKRALFDENIRYGFEELDMAKHAVALGYKINYCDDLYVNHYPSSVNREHYKQFTHASRLYATTKAYLYYDRSWLKASLFILLAPLKLAVFLVKQGDLWGWWKAIRATAIASGYFLRRPTITL